MIAKLKELVMFNLNLGAEDFEKLVVWEAANSGLLIDRQEWFVVWLVVRQEKWEDNIWGATTIGQYWMCRFAEGCNRVNWVADLYELDRFNEAMAKVGAERKMQWQDNKSSLVVSGCEWLADTLGDVGDLSLESILDVMIHEIENCELNEECDELVRAVYGAYCLINSDVAENLYPGADEEMGILWLRICAGRDWEVVRHAYEHKDLKEQFLKLFDKEIVDVIGSMRNTIWNPR